MLIHELVMELLDFPGMFAVALHFLDKNGRIHASTTDALRQYMPSLFGFTTRDRALFEAVAGTLTNVQQQALDRLLAKLKNEGERVRFQRHIIFVPIGTEERTDTKGKKTLVPATPLGPNDVRVLTLKHIADAAAVDIDAEIERLRMRTVLHSQQRHELAEQILCYLCGVSSINDITKDVVARVFGNIADKAEPTGSYRQNIWMRVFSRVW